MIALLVSMFVAAPPSHLPAPHVMVVLPSARAAIALASKFQKSPLDVATLETLGVALDAPAYAYVVADEGVVELAIANSKLTEGAFELALLKKRAKKLAATEGVDRAIELVVEKTRLFVARAGDRLFVTRARAAWPSVAIASAQAATKPSAPPKWIAFVEKKPVAWFFARGIEGLERLEGAVFAEGKTIDLRVNAMLDFAAGLLVADLAHTPGKSRALFNEAGAVVEVTAFLPSSAIANMFELSAISALHAKNASGRVHVALAKNGALIVAVEPREGASAAESEALRAALSAKLDGVDVRVLAPLEEERSPIELRAKPRELLDALEARAKTKSSVRLLRPEVAVARARLDGILSKIENAKVDLAVTPAGVELRALLSAL